MNTSLLGPGRAGLELQLLAVLHVPLVSSSQVTGVAAGSLAADKTAAAKTNKPNHRVFILVGAHVHSFRQGLH